MALIDIGTTRQLFIDDYLIESLLHARRVLNPAQKSSHNPIFPADRPWEGTYNQVNYVYYDEAQRHFKMWYTTCRYVTRFITDPASKSYNRVKPLLAEGSMRPCLATSQDGIHWEKPALGLVEFAGSRANNLLPSADAVKYIFRDPHDQDPARRFKGLVRYGDSDPARVRQVEEASDIYYTKAPHWIDDLERRGVASTTIWDLYYSSDGITWTPYSHNPVIASPPRAPLLAGPTRFMWDPIRATYAAYTEPSQHSRSTDMERHGRTVGRAESADMIHWDLPETIIVPDDHDPPDAQFYFATFSAYQGNYLGLLDVYRLNSGAIYPTLVFSRDGIHYQRDFRAPIIELGAADAFDAKEIYPLSPIVHGDQVLLYYYGCSSGHDMGPIYDELQGGEEMRAAIGLATLPIDRFVSIDGGKQPAGELTTRSFTFAGKQLHLNVSGRVHEMVVKVQVLGPTSHIIPGHTYEDADPITTDGLDHIATWNGSADLSHLEGKAIKLRILLEKARLYSFWFN